MGEKWVSLQQTHFLLFPNDPEKTNFLKDSTDFVCNIPIRSRSFGIGYWGEVLLQKPKTKKYLTFKCFLLNYEGKTLQNNDLQQRYGFANVSHQPLLNLVSYLGAVFELSI